jgi:F-type H+-transporting ATPase subunit b
VNELFAAFGVNWHLLLIQAINFGLVLVALWYFVYRPVFSFLAKRQELVAQGVADAKQAGEKLSHADEAARTRVHTAEVQAEGIVAAARAQGHEESERRIKDAEARAVSITTDAEARARESALRIERESEQEIARLSVLAAEKLLKKHYD